MRSFAARQRRIGRFSVALSALGLPCAALAVWGARLVAISRGEWTILGWIIGGGALLIGGPGTVMAIRRLLVGLALLRNRPNAVERAKRVADATIALHVVVWAIAFWPMSYLRSADFQWEVVASLLGALTLSAIVVGHALAARALFRDATTTSSARPL